MHRQQQRNMRREVQARKAWGQNFPTFKRGKLFLQTFPFNLAHMLPLKFLTLTGPNCSLKHQLVLGWAK